MGVCGYHAFENICRKLTQRQLHALGGQPREENGRSEAPSNSTFQRVLKAVDPRQRSPRRQTTPSPEAQAFRRLFRRPEGAFAVPAFCNPLILNNIF